MKTFLCITFCLFSCHCFSQTQREMNMAACQDSKLSEKKLNKIYNQIFNDNKDDTLFIKNFRAAQRQWLKFRTAQLEVKFPKGHENEQGTVRPMCYCIYEAYLTNQRIKELKEMIIGEEGNVCR